MEACRVKPELNRAQLAAAMGVSDSTVGRWLAAGLPHTPIGVRGKRFDLAECRAWLRSQYPLMQPAQASKPANKSMLQSPAATYTEAAGRVHQRVKPSAK